MLALLMAGCICLLTGCSDDTEPSQDGHVLQVAGVTRAADDVLSVEEVNTDGTQIKIFLTTNDETQTAVTTGQFTCTSNGSWNSTVAIKENIQYYVYGYMPAGATGTVSPYSNDYSQGVDMTLSGLPAIGDKDICVLTGIQQVTSATAAKEPWKERHEGQFGYLAVASNGNTGNYAYLLMDHIYGALKFQFNVNEVYAGLRTIHLKEVTLKTDYSTVNATVQLRKGVGINNSNSVSYSDLGGEEMTIALLTEDDTEVVLPVKTATPSATVIGSEYYCAPTAELFDTEGSHASIVCKYDIYDNNGNLIRKDCTATNKLKFTSGMARGKKKILTLTVNPTYLYMLSEPDLDNPTIELN